MACCLKSFYYLCIQVKPLVIGMEKCLLSMVAIALVLMGCATQQERAARRELVRKAVAEAVATRRLHIDITSMNTMRYGSRVVTPDFFLELRGDTLRSYLPYLGQAHQAPMMSPSQGLNFETRMLHVTESHPKAQLTRFEIDVKTKEDIYVYVVEVYDTGKSYIHVRSQNRDPISFDGEASPFSNNE